MKSAGFPSLGTSENNSVTAGFPSGRWSNEAAANDSN